MTKAAGSSERRPRDIDRSRRQHLAAQAADAAQITEDFETGQLAGTAAAPMAESAPPAPSTTPGPNDPGDLDGPPSAAQCRTGRRLSNGQRATGNGQRQGLLRWQGRHRLLRQRGGPGPRPGRLRRPRRHRGVHVCVGV